jgi:hypothetical protein
MEKVCRPNPVTPRFFIAQRYLKLFFASVEKLYCPRFFAERKKADICHTFLRSSSISFLEGVLTLVVSRLSDRSGE